MKRLTAFLAALLLAGQAAAATAFFTGNMRQVTTVTYQIAWSCQYNYNGQLFWRVFKSHCPPSVEVE